MPEHVIRAGDTLRGLAQRFLGDANQWRRIYEASNFRSGNPDLIYPGEVAIIPDVVPPPAVSSSERLPGSDIVGLTINGKEFLGWESLSIMRTLDTCSDAFAVSAPFMPEDPQVKDAFRPFGYQLAEIRIDEQKILTGRIEAIDASEKAEDRTITVQGRSLTGALIDCSIDIGRLGFAGLKLSQIANLLCAPFGIATVISSDSPVLREANAQPGEPVYSFLSRLAQDSGLILSNDADGNLTIGKVVAISAPVAALVAGQGRLMDVSASYNGQSRFSRYKVFQQQDGAHGIRGEALDSGVSVYRPIVQTGAEGNAAQIAQAAEWQRALALADSIQVVASWSGWRRPDGVLWAPGDVVTLQAPAAMIYNETKMILKSVTFKLDTSSGRTAELGMILPATFTGQMPEEYPW